MREDNQLEAHTSIIIMEEFDGDGYELEFVQRTAPIEEQTGITFKGKDKEYLEAQKVLKDFMKNKGDIFLINGIEMIISDTPKNRPMIVGVKPKDGISGKVNLKFFDKYDRGGATIMIQKAKGGDNAMVQILGIKVIKYLLDKMLQGNIQESELLSFKIKTKNCVTGENKCDVSDRVFRTEQGLKLHVKRTHEGAIKCTTCKKTFQTKEDVELHIKRVHTGECNCVICGIDFEINQELHLHMTRVHKNEKTYCEVCRVFLKGDSEFEKHKKLEH